MISIHFLALQIYNTASIKIEGFNPYFYIKVDDDWNDQRKNIFVANYLKKKIGIYKYLLV